MSTQDVLPAIAVIGMAGRFPGAPTIEAFWDNLRRGVESITHFPPEELEDAFAARCKASLAMCAQGPFWTAWSFLMRASSISCLERRS